MCLVVAIDMKSKITTAIALDGSYQIFTYFGLPACLAHSRLVASPLLIAARKFWDFTHACPGPIQS